MGIFDWLVKWVTGAEPAEKPPAPGRAGGPTSAPRKKGSGLESLDPGIFQPLTSTQLKLRANFVGSVWPNPWFGRRDLIPPVSDARTLLVDRGMVGAGFITPFELQEIHEIGLEMDRIRPDLAHAAENAKQVREARLQEKEAIKRRKKEEAAMRREARAKAVVGRRATDIMFAGRGVSAWLHDRRVHVEALQAKGLPVLASPADLAQAIGITVPALRWRCYHDEAARRVHYVTFEVPKRSGGVRLLATPHRRLRACQDWIRREILAKLPVTEAAHGFVSGRSAVTNARVHAGQQLVVNFDLKDFFPTITFPRVRGIFRAQGFSPAVSTLLALLTTEAPRRKVTMGRDLYHIALGPRALPQGAPTSPALSNQAARFLDMRLAALAAKMGWNYTRYADDLTFSTSGEPAARVAYLMAKVRHIAENEGFELNERKTRVLRPGRAQEVTGLVVNHHAAVPRATVRRLRSILHHAAKEGLEAQNREGHPHFRDWLTGWIAYVSMVEPTKGAKLRAAYDALP